MIPNQPGSYLWVDHQGFIGPKKQVWNIHVVDVGTPSAPWLRAYWNGGYYNLLPDDFTPEEECWPKEGWL